MGSSTWVALLRAVNLGPRRRLAMADLRASLESLGFEDVRTFLQSGNAVFRTGRRAASRLERELEQRLEADLGLSVTVMLRSATELGAIVAANPFAARRVKASELHVVFLASAPPAVKMTGIDAGTYAPDGFAFGDRVVYVRLHRGVMGSRLPNWEQVLGVRATMRTWNTVTRLRALASGE